MLTRHRAAFTIVTIIAAATGMALAQGRPDPAAIMAAQRQALQKLAFMDGVWKGQAWTLLPTGEKHTLAQTERIGPFLDGTVKVIEGRGYEADGVLSFNALGIVSWDAAKGAYNFRAYTQGYAGDFALAPTDDGFTWEIPAGPITMRYTAVVKDGSWHEVGDRIMPDKREVRFFEMTLSRVDDTDWPAAGAIDPG